MMRKKILTKLATKKEVYESPVIDELSFKSIDVITTSNTEQIIEDYVEYEWED